MSTPLERAITSYSSQLRPHVQQQAIQLIATEYGIYKFKLLSGTSVTDRSVTGKRVNIPPAARPGIRL